MGKTYMLNSNSLSHYGVKGMHWGVRKDEYSTTSYKPNSKIVSSTNTTKKVVQKAFDPSIKRGKGKDPISPVESVGSSIKRGTDATSNLLSTMDKRQRRKNGDGYDYSDIHKMSDAELRNRINRINMEKQYAQLTQSQTQSGYDKAKDVLDMVGDVATVLIAVGGAYTAIKKIKG